MFGPNPRPRLFRRLAKRYGTLPITTYPPENGWVLCSCGNRFAVITTEHLVTHPTKEHPTHRICLYILRELSLAHRSPLIKDTSTLRNWKTPTGHDMHVISELLKTPNPQRLPLPHEFREITIFLRTTKQKTYAEIQTLLGGRNVAALLGPSPITKSQVRDRAGYRCQDCSHKTRSGHIHHISTKVTPDEYNTPQNLVYLCRQCHRRRHTLA